MADYHFNSRVREIFRKIYQGKRINLKASKKTLEQQLDLYLEHFSVHTGKPIASKEKTRIWSAIERNNQVAKVLNANIFKKLVKRVRDLMDGTFVGYIFCIDGRIPAIFAGGRFAKFFENPAAEVAIIKRKSDNKLIPDSSDLIEALRRVASMGDDLLEIVAAHTSILDPHHGCGAMAAKKKAGLLDPKLSLEDANLEIIKKRTIPALSNIYNEFRVQLGLSPLKIVGIPALYDTDTFGLFLNYDLRDEGKTLSTTELTNKYKDELDEYFIKKNLVFASFGAKFSDLKYLTPFFQNTVEAIEDIFSGKVATGLAQEVEEYITKFYPDLTQRQKQTLKFILIRNMTIQYLTGLSSVKKRTLDHPFAEHEEGYMAVAMRGGTIGKFDPQNQVFASTPSDPQEAIQNINIKLSIMGNSPKIKPYILFVCNSITRSDLEKNSDVLQRLMGSNAGLLRDIIADHKLGAMIESGEMIPVPVLVEEDSREVLKIADHSAYI